jgi:hypothetical protein
MNENLPKEIAALASQKAITAKNFGAKALQFAKTSGETEFPTITLGSPACAAWGKYFDLYLKGRPWAYRALIAGTIKEMTVPTQWPEWFDAAYAAAKVA